MAATISTAKLATAFQGPGHVTIYALFEQSYATNCYPHRPEWSCISLGRIATVMLRIFKSAADCVSGAIQVKGDKLNAPEDYIAGWLIELATPMELPHQDFSLKISDDFRATIPLEDAQEVLDLLDRNGHEGVAQTLRAGGTYKGTLHADSALVVRLFGGGPMPPWRLIRDKPNAAKCPGLDTGQWPKRPPWCKCQPSCELTATPA